ncbi:type II toxin-antitoxin system RelE/ParE family toxin [Pelomonas sp. SE-A7]|uniref:type II toxin-antitoxin system RelE/ParE family toxin n=1 Tax=Pelomonas sp. SE-A7 TaxID=3054953 RepID=UPI00259D0AB4|nr:type II toxin-antitoxin system RelE/ParE family toxin [Pelomonas sp. SE-A7]MDM4766434.1 type II toxin-antitoxin system RelE/ParE family toxin [Pelomonas sp. SE-A7]
MARIELAPEVLDDMERFLSHLEQHEASHPLQRVAELIQGLQILASHPLIGRPARSGKRELVIGQGVRGYIALYRFVERLDTVFVLALRSQREAGFKR